MEKRYNHITCDPLAHDIWKKHQTYTANKSEQPTFTIDTPPPTVSGSLHIGHIFSYTQTDIIARYKRMTGHNVFYPFGFDGNGLPTERMVEKKHKTSAHKIGREAFIKLCLEATQEAQEKFIALWQTMGLSANFNQTYSTISNNVQKIAQESFLRLLKDDYAYMQEEPALYCTRCRTTVAQADLDDIEHTTTFNDIVFKTKEDKELIISTTRPELLPSCVALLYHPDDSRYKQLKNSSAISPLFNQEVPILEDELVQQDKGTGLVMVCTFGDKNDIEWFKKHKLNYRQSIGFDGKITEEGGPLAGLTVAQARQKVLELLKDNNLLRTQKEIVHSVQTHERCKQDIEYVILPQWFINVVKHKQHFLDAADGINWNPQHMKSRFIDWVSNLSWDWCISRQRIYGIPFPVWHCQDCKEILPADINELPIDPQQVSYKGTCSKCGGSNIRPDTDVMDTWNTSSLTPYICKQLFNGNDDSPFDGNSFIPMSMRPQAHDIIRTWAFYTIIKAWMHQKEIPWKDIVISGYVLSEQKEKISKSKNNAPEEPEQLLKLYAPDAIRFWTASGTLGQDIAFSHDQIKIGQKLLNKLWNAFKFMKMNLEEYQPGKAQHSHNVVNQWMIDQTNNALSKYKQYLDQHEFSLSLQAVEHLFWNDFCDNYIEIIKDQFFNPDNYTPEQIQQTKDTLYATGLKILQMYAPYLPHITESLYQEIFAQFEDEPSIHITQLPTGSAVDEQNQQHMNVLLAIISQVRKLKTTHELALRTEIESLTLHTTDSATAQMIQEQQAVLQGVCKAKKIQVSNESGTTELVQKDDQIDISVSI